MSSMLMFVREGGTGALLVLATAPLALLVVLGAGILLIANRRVPPVLAVGALGLPGLVGLLAGLASWGRGLEAVAHASPETKQTLLAASVAGHLATDVLPGWALVLPVLLLALLAGIAGALRGPRRRSLPVTVGILALVLAALPVVGALAVEASLADALVRGAIYLAAGAGTAVALLGADRDTSGPTAGATAALALPLLVGAMELASMATTHTVVFEAVAHASADSKAELFNRGLDLVAAQRPFAWLALALAAAVAVMGCLGALDRSRRSAWVVAGLGALAVPALALWFDSTELLLLMATMFQ